MTETVSFRAMEEGTQADYALLNKLEKKYTQALPDRIIKTLEMQAHDTLEGYKISRLEHSLQTATRAVRDGADDEAVVCALIHDIGDGLAPCNHSELAASIVKPYVSEKNHWIILHHGLFQTYYFNHHLGLDRNLRDQYVDHPWYQSCVDFCHRWDQASFDPDYESLPMDYFVAKVQEIFSRPCFDESILNQEF